MLLHFLAFYLYKSVCGQDVVFDEESVKSLPTENKDLGLMWPRGIVSYTMDLNSFDVHLLHRLRHAMNVIESESCLKFQPDLAVAPTDQLTKYYLNITANREDRQCIHAVEHKREGQIVVKVGYECLKRRQLLHTLLHGVGLADEVAHPHRDKYVRVLWENILPEYLHLFRVQHSTDAAALVEYDPTSVMHFHDRAYSRNGEATIAPLLPGLIIQPSDNPTQLDKLKLQKLFGHECNKRKVCTYMSSCKTVLHKSEKSKNRERFEKANSDGDKCERKKLVGEEVDGDNNGKDKGVDASRVAPNSKTLKADKFTIDRLQNIEASADYD